MGHADGDEPEKKKRLVNCEPSPLSNKNVDAAVLQYQNQKLVQQLDSQKSEMHLLEGKVKELGDKQVSYDEILITVNRLWNQLVDDLILLGLRAGGYEKGLQALDHVDLSRDSLPSCPPEETFLCRLLQVDSIERSGENDRSKFVEEALAARHASTLELMKHLEETIDAQRAKNEKLSVLLVGKVPAEEVLVQVLNINDLLKEEASNLHRVIDVLHSKQKEYADEMQKYHESYSADQSEIKRLSGELEESMAELEESRRKLVNLKMQIDGAHGVQIPVLSTVNGGSSPDKLADRSMGFQELKESVEVSKMLASTRLLELEEAREDNLILSEKLKKLQNELQDDKFILSSKPYTLLVDKLQHLNSEVERYKGLTDSSQAESNYILRREKELSLKAESSDAVRCAVGESEVKIEDLKLQLQKCIIERNDLETKLEEAEQDSGRKDIKAEFRVMASALSKEMEMMEVQLKRCKDTACEALSLQEEAQSLRALLEEKVTEHKVMSDRCAKQAVEIKSLKALIEILQEKKQELLIFLDMYGQQCFDNRDVAEIKESEGRAHGQAKMLRTLLDEHSLELRVKAANEAEAACQQRLSIAEAEIADLRMKLDASERQIYELTEAIKIKYGEADTYMSEIETIGQAYEDMQTQNQHLLQQITERDDYNIKLVSESVKIKQAQNSLLSEKQAIAKQLQQVNASLDVYKQSVSCYQEEMKASILQAVKSVRQNRHVSLKLENVKLELADAEKELKWLKSAIDSSEKEYEQNQRKIAQLHKELENERTGKKKLQEELSEWNSKVAEMSSENRETTVQKLQDEIKECKAILKCGVCFDRPKEVVITKCYHLFCNQCIQRNLEIRHRKCPGCGMPFGQNDVREVKI